MLDLPQRTHNRFISPLIKSPRLYAQLVVRFAKFFTSGINSINPLVKGCCKTLLHSRTPAANNLRCINMHTASNEKELVHLAGDGRALVGRVRVAFCAPDDSVLEAEVSVINDLMNVRDGASDAPLSPAEAADLFE